MGRSNTSIARVVVFFFFSKTKRGFGEILEKEQVGVGKIVEKKNKKDEVDFWVKI